MRLTSPSPDAPNSLPKKILVINLEEMPTTCIIVAFDDFKKISFMYLSKVKLIYLLVKKTNSFV